MATGSCATMLAMGFLGSTLFIGVGACFVATLLVIPVLAGLGYYFANRKGGA